MKNAFGHLGFAGRTDVGCRRKNNEDACGAFPQYGLWCVADGMGGCDDGEIASSSIMEALTEFTALRRPPEGSAWVRKDAVDAVAAAVDRVSSRLCQRSRSRNLKGCGAVFVSVLFDAAKPALATALHAGDSRLYQIRGRTIRQVTRDHSPTEMLGETDENKINPAFRGMVLRAVGLNPRVELERTEFAVKEGDILLLCSDGLYRMVDTPEKIAGIICGSPDLAAAAERLVAAAREGGGVDNITVVLVGVGPLPEPLAETPMPPPDEEDDEDTADGDSATVDDTGEGAGSTDGETRATCCGDAEDFSAEACPVFLGRTDSGSFASPEPFRIESREGGRPFVSIGSSAGRSSGSRRLRLMVWIALAAVIAVAVVVAILLSGKGSDAGPAQEGPVEKPAAVEPAEPKPAEKPVVVEQTPKPVETVSPAPAAKPAVTNDAVEVEPVVFAPAVKKR